MIPLVTKAVIDGPIATSDQRGLVALGLLAIGLGVLEAVLMFLRRWIVTEGTIGVETSIRTRPVRQAAAAADVASTASGSPASCCPGS